MIAKNLDTSQILGYLKENGFKIMFEDGVEKSIKRYNHSIRRRDKQNNHHNNSDNAEEQTKSYSFTKQRQQQHSYILR